MVPKIYNFHNLPPILPTLQKYHRLSEHDAVIETQTIKVCPLQNFLAISVPETGPPWASEGYFLGGPARDFTTTFSRGGPKVVNFGFYPSKIKKAFFASKFKIQGGLAPLLPPSDANEGLQTFCQRATWAITQQFEGRCLT